MATLAIPRCCCRAIPVGSFSEKSRRHVASLAALPTCYKGGRGSAIVVVSLTCGCKSHPFIKASSITDYRVGCNTVVISATSSSSSSSTTTTTTTLAKNGVALFSPNQPTEIQSTDNTLSELDMIRLERALLNKAPIQSTEKNGHEAYVSMLRDNAIAFMPSTDHNRINGRNSASISCTEAQKGNEKEPKSYFSSVGDSLTAGQSFNDVEVVVRSTRRFRKRLRKEKRMEVPKENISPTLLTTLRKQDSQIRLKRVQSQTDPPRGSRNRHRFFSSSEVIELARGTKDLLAVEAVQRGLTKRMGRMPNLMELARVLGDDLDALTNRLHRGQQCKETMIQCNRRLIMSVAKRFHGIGLTMEDLVQEGNIGLMKGCEKFDPDKGFMFSTYACWWIRQSISEAIAEHSRMIRLPKHIFDTYVRIRSTMRVFAAKHGRNPLDKEIAELLDMSVEVVRMIMRAGTCSKSFDYAYGSDKDIKLKDIIAETGPDCSESVVNRRLARQELKVVLSALTAQERKVIYLRYGVDDGKWRPFEDIGKEMGISRERVRQLEAKAMRKLRQPEFSQGLSIFFTG